MDLIIKNMQLLSSPDVNWWIRLLWCFYQLFGLSFWRHPFTTEHPLMRHWWSYLNLFQLLWLLHCYTDDYIFMFRHPASFCNSDLSPVISARGRSVNVWVCVCVCVCTRLMGRISSAPPSLTVSRYTHTHTHTLAHSQLSNFSSVPSVRINNTEASGLRVRILHLKCLDFSTWICGNVIWVERVCEVLIHLGTWTRVFRNGSLLTVFSIAPAKLLFYLDNCIFLSDLMGSVSRRSHRGIVMRVW